MSGIEIIVENDNFVALNKPAGLLSVPDRYDQALPSLKKILQEGYGEIFVVHRLDRETSGLIIFAKNENAHKHYSQIFSEREVEKYYLGMVRGSLEPKKSTIDIPIAENEVTKGKMLTHKRGKPSITHYEVVEEFSGFSWVQFRIETGRTHQIRVHMQHAGHPILCDELYGSKDPVFLSSLKRNFKLSKNEFEERPLLARLALHSSKLKFNDVTGERVELEAPLPRDLNALLKQIRKRK